jgi:hypothetical protein
MVILIENLKISLIKDYEHKALTEHSKKLLQHKSIKFYKIIVTFYEVPKLYIPKKKKKSYNQVLYL